jgi:PilZ domain-containing protein
MAKPAHVASTNTSQSSAKVERRRSQRHACKLSASWHFLGESGIQFMPATVQDISRTGIALRVQTECKKGAIISIRLRSQTQSSEGSRPGQVVHVRQLEPGVWILGCAFCHEMTEAELQEILPSGGLLARFNASRLPEPATTIVAASPRPSSSDKERRSEPRRDGKQVGVIIGLANGKRFLGKVLNVSANGMALVVPRSLPVGTILKVRATSAAISVPWATLIVRHCQRSNQRIVGCQAADVLSASLLETICPKPK